MKVAWRYNDLLEQRPEQKTIKPGNYQTPEYKFDSSRSMGEAVANQATHALDKDLLVHLAFDPEQ